MNRKPWVNCEPQPITFPEVRRTFNYASATVVDPARCPTIYPSGPRRRSSCHVCGTAIASSSDLFCGECGQRLR